MIEMSMAASLRSGLGFVGMSPPPPRGMTFSRTEPPLPAVAGLYAAATAAIASRRIIEDVARALEPLNKQPRCNAICATARMDKPQ